MTKIRRNERSLISGVIVLSVSGVLVKVSGLLFKVPLTNMIGRDGMQ